MKIYTNAIFLQMGQGKSLNFSSEHKYIHINTTPNEQNFISGWHYRLGIGRESHFEKKCISI